MGETLICYPFHSPLPQALNPGREMKLEDFVGVVTGNCGVVRLQRRMLNSCFQGTFLSCQSFIPSVLGLYDVGHSVDGSIRHQGVKLASLIPLSGWLVVALTPRHLFKSS